MQTNRTSHAYSIIRNKKNVEKKTARQKLKGVQDFPVVYALAPDGSESPPNEGTSKKTGRTG
jgi:hypothetical protein